MALPDYVTGYANIVKQTDELAAGMTPALVQEPVMAMQIYMEDLPTQSDTKKFVEDGYITASTVAEGNEITIDANVELTQTSTDLTVIKKAATLIVTQKAQKFANFDINKGIPYVGSALGRGIESVVITAIASVTQGVTAASTATLTEYEDCVLLIRQRTNGVSKGRLVAINNFKPVSSVRKELIAGANANFGIPSQLSLLAGVTAPNGYVGSYGGVDHFETGSIASSQSIYTNVVFDPTLAFCGVASPSPEIKLDYTPLAGSDNDWGSVDSIDGWVWVQAGVWNDEAAAYYKTAA